MCARAQKLEFAILCQTTDRTPMMTQTHARVCGDGGGGTVKHRDL